MEAVISLTIPDLGHIAANCAVRFLGNIVLEQGLIKKESGDLDEMEELRCSWGGGRMR